MRTEGTPYGPSFGDVERVVHEVRGILQDATRGLHVGDSSVTWVRVDVSDAPDTYRITFGGRTRT